MKLKDHLIKLANGNKYINMTSREISILVDRHENYVRSMMNDLGIRYKNSKKILYEGRDIVKELSDTIIYDEFLEEKVIPYTYRQIERKFKIYYSDIKEVEKKLNVRTMTTGEQGVKKRREIAKVIDGNLNHLTYTEIAKELDVSYAAVLSACEENYVDTKTNPIYAAMPLREEEEVFIKEHKKRLYLEQIAAYLGKPEKNIEYQAKIRGWKLYEMPVDADRNITAYSKIENQLETGKVYRLKLDEGFEIQKSEFEILKEYDYFYTAKTNSGRVTTIHKFDRSLINYGEVNQNQTNINNRGRVIRS